MKETEGMTIPSAVEVIRLPSPFTGVNLAGMNGVIFEEGEWKGVYRRGKSGSACLSAPVFAFAR